MALLRDFGLVLRQAVASALLRSTLLGLFYIAVGMTLPDFVSGVMERPPTWLTTWWFRLLFILALAAISLSVLYLRFGHKRDKARQDAIDSLSRDLSRAIHELLNRPRPAPISPDYVANWQTDFQGWCDLVSQKLRDRHFFTESDQLHFDRLGVVPQLTISGHPQLDWLISMLSLKFDRLREIIRSVPQRPL